MIIGHGLLARSFAPHFADCQDVTIFGSGVSNSLESRPEAFERERMLLSETLGRANGRTVYFSSCGVAFAAQGLTPYMEHKLRMEALVAAAGGLVLRLPQVVSRTDNPHTLANFLRDRIVSGEHFTIWENAERNLVDIDDIVAIGTHIVRETSAPATLAIASEHSLQMPEIIDIFERILGRAANYSVEKKGVPMSIETSVARSIAASLGIDLGNGYAERVLRKYYGGHEPSGADATIA